MRVHAQEAGKAGMTMGQTVSLMDMLMDMPADMPADSPTDSLTELLMDMPTELTDEQINEVDNKTSGTHISDSPTDLTDEQAEADPKLIEAPTNMTRADVLLRYITLAAPENEVKLKVLLVHVTTKLANGQAGGHTGLLHKFVFSRFFRESGATVTCVMCEQFWPLTKIFIDSDKAMYCYICWICYCKECPLVLLVQEMLSESATVYYNNCDKILMTELFDDEHACNKTAPQ